jgi:hypothetical protein
VPPAHTDSCSTAETQTWSNATCQGHTALRKTQRTGEAMDRSAALLDTIPMRPRLVIMSPLDVPYGHAGRLLSWAGNAHGCLLPQHNFSTAQHAAPQGAMHRQQHTCQHGTREAVQPNDKSAEPGQQPTSSMRNSELWVPALAACTAPQAPLSVGCVCDDVNCSCAFWVTHHSPHCPNVVALVRSWVRDILQLPPSHVNRD